ncbi:MAG: bifunctional UDP-3-O-[3-hydroxymyristoyl] N-acetylglucosamine deacetylase/3-hydroxyacyl-ACP dehydratase [Verrucomicrobiales bacterium]|jgi:UDP-3-O-[3-hydroxymyristoyl] N-acetylglucosamine deacetylase/3-hydroxyacyl-[acyl-carrier-protein] dehydratase|nr:bifunctional UDP-3-O-[3-hydroxymyristoyl] N-acetylglucosamine deacetylase/3-hydroxyacyl-ACP dehydratase [Verrucomicrobiales bacterium]
MPVINQTTIEREASLMGTSLHTGRKVKLTIKPAEADTGYVFKRVDLPDAPTISAGVELVRQVERATTISEGAVKIHTIEHLLSALRGLGIDNALIEMDSNEPPIGDGSADLFVQLIEKTGRKELPVPRVYFELREPVYVYGKDDSYMVALPHDSFKVTCTNANHTGFHTQYFSYSLSAETYAKEISKARTFVFYEEVQPLLEKGLIKGGSLENAVVIKGESLLSKEAMRYPDEFVRHKILDIIGDLSLFPMHLKAHIIAAKPSHGLNVELTKAIAREYKRYISQLMPIEHIPVGEGALDTQEVMRILPHRYPFLMVDRILKFEGETRATGCKNITINEPYFQGHFPGHPVMPGVLQIEAMAQVASILMLRRAENVGRIGFFMSADKVKFRKPVMPGDTLIIQAELTKQRGKIGKAAGQCTVNGEVVSECELSFVVQ